MARHRLLIDVDETKFNLVGLNPNYGFESDPGCGARESWSGPSREGSVELPRKWWLLTNQNVDQEEFAEFLDTVCLDIEENPTEGDNERMFLWDNLSVHLTDYVAATLEERPTRNWSL